jgi:hypothetical protein
VQDKNDLDQSELVNLSELLNRPIDPRLLTDAPGDSVSRITLKGGQVEQIDAEARWNLAARNRIPMADEVVWRIDGLPDEGVTVAPRGSTPTAGRRRIRSRR